LGQLIVAVGTLVAAQCDVYVKKQCSAYPDRRLAKVIESSLCCKARLLHYFDCSHDLNREDSSNNSHDPFSSWCGWHNDHGSLTGLVSAMFVDAEGNQVQNTDPDAGEITERTTPLILGRTLLQKQKEPIGEGRHPTGSFGISDR
jgi:hypothetical protein